jgi:hypothetical protein
MLIFISFSFSFFVFLGWCGQACLCARWQDAEPEGQGVEGSLEN